MRKVAGRVGLGDCTALVVDWRFIGFFYGLTDTLLHSFWGDCSGWVNAHPTLFVLAKLQPKREHRIAV